MEIMGYGSGFRAGALRAAYPHASLRGLTHWLPRVVTILARTAIEKRSDSYFTPTSSGGRRSHPRRLTW